MKKLMTVLLILSLMCPVWGSRAEETENASGQASAITLDDVTKIIVQKIKKNRSNNEKIGQILKAYGVAKVGELPDTKYEAFLTDLSQL